MPGSHINPVYHDTMADYAKIEKSLDDIINESGAKYFNTLNIKRDKLTFIPNKKGSATRYGVKGNWIIPNIDALKSKSLRASNNTSDWISVGDVVETPFYKIKFNQDGSIDSLYDKELSREWTDGEFNKLKMYTDYPGNYDAWDILPNYKDKEVNFEVDSPLVLVEKDGECATFKTVLKTEQSTWELFIRLFNRSRGIEVESKVDWHEKHKLAKVEFNTNVLSRKALCDTSAGFIERDTHKNTSWQQARFEVCHHKWCDISESDCGVALINDGKYGVGFDENTMSLSLLRSTIRPDVVSDMGCHNFCYMIMPHKHNAIYAGVNDIAIQYNVPLVRADVEWNMPKFEPLYIQAVKMSEDKKYTIIRLSEQNGTRGEIKLDKKVKVMNMLEEVEYETDTLSYKPFEILTIGVD